MRCRDWIGMLATASLVACGPLEPAPAPPRQPFPWPPPRPTPAPKPSRPSAIPTRPLNIAADCSFRDETGYRGAMKLSVANSEVRQFEASLDMPRRGACRFALKDFRQSATFPGVTLNAARSKCVVRMWEQGRRVSIAFMNCESMCSGVAHSYLWPILADARDGTCG